MKNFKYFSKLILLLIISGTFIILIKNAHANGVLVDAMGPVAGGRGGTNIAYFDNAVLLHDNPGALANLEGKQLDCSIDFINLPMKFKNTLNDKKGEDQLFILPTISYTRPIGKDDLVLGIGLFNPAGFSTEYRLMHPAYGDQKYYSYASLTKLLFGLGWKFNNRLSLGVAVGPAYTQTELEFPYTFQTGVLASTPILINMDGDDLSLCWNFGLQWKLSSETTFGLSYVDQDKFHIDGDIDVDGTGVILVPDPTAHYKISFDYRWPRMVGAGVVHQFESIHRLSFDVLWIDWSSAFNEWKLSMSEGDSSSLYTVLEDTFPLHWKDSYAFRLGYEYLLNTKDTLRFGYIYNKNPVPAATQTSLVPGIFKQGISFGYGRQWENWKFNAAYYYSFENEQSVETSEILGGDFNQSTLKVGIHFLSIGLQYSF